MTDDQVSFYISREEIEDEAEDEEREEVTSGYDEKRMGEGKEMDVDWAEEEKIQEFQSARIRVDFIE